MTEITTEIRNRKYWEELIAYFPLTRNGPHRKRRLKQFFVAAGTSLPNPYLATIRGIHRPTRPTILLLLSVFIAAGTCLPSRCLAMKWAIHFTEPLFWTNMRDTHTDTHRLTNSMELSPSWEAASLSSAQGSGILYIVINMYKKVKLTGRRGP
jgi:hypothetical protein